MFFVSLFPEIFIVCLRHIVQNLGKRQITLSFCVEWVPSSLQWQGWLVVLLVHLEKLVKIGKKNFTEKQKIIIE